MSWNTSLMAGPQPIPVYGPPTTDPVTGALLDNITGYQGVAFVFPANRLPAGLEASAVDLPKGVSTLSGVNCKALVYADEESAKIPLSDYWENET